MEVAAAFTVWITFGGWLFLGVVTAPRVFGRIALTLCAAELVATAVWSYGSETCLRRPCATVARMTEARTRHIQAVVTAPQVGQKSPARNEHRAKKKRRQAEVGAP